MKRKMMKALIAGLITIQSAVAQTNLSIVPDIINTAGNYVKIGTDQYDYNIGEMVLVDTYYLPGAIFTQGFLQPYYFGNAIQPHPVSPVQNNFITPNGDGKNDVLFFEDLEKYPDNRLRIFDRAGRQLYHSAPYHNEWNGMLAGQLLNEDTYYYVLELGPGLAAYRGFVTIVYDQRGGKP